MGDNATRTITVGETGEDIDLFFQGYVSHFHGITWGYMTKAGPGTVAFSNSTYTVQLGSLTVSEGEARFINALSVGSLGNGGLINNARARVEITAGMTQTCAAAISGSGVLIKTGDGQLTVNSAIGAAQSVVVDGGTLVFPTAQAYAGATTISNGLLLVQGSIVNAVTVESGGTLGGTGVLRGAVTQNGTISPGVGIGTLTISNDLTDAVSGVTLIELGGTNAPTDYDRLLVSGTHLLQGTLRVVTTNGYVPASGDSFLVISNSALGGGIISTFGTETLPALASGLGWVVTTGSESVSLTVTGSLFSPTPYELWAQSITNPALRGEQEDADGDGYANLLEYSQGSDATNSADNAKLTLVRSNGQFLAVFNRVNTAVDIVYEVEGSYVPTNGASWLGIATNVIGSWGSSTNVNDDNTAAVHRVWVTDLELGTNRSLRLKITRP
jgi:autotransporter-associated beta strand protein